jgi:hypothetical protein
MKQVSQVRCWVMRSCERQQHGRIYTSRRWRYSHHLELRNSTVAIRMSGLMALKAICCRLA